MQAAPHILIVDDHREIRDLVSRALSKDGFRVSGAADGRAMRKVLADSRIDLILLDLMLPGEDGLALCRALRAESNIPIIMLTAKGDEVDRVVGLEMGADDYLPKPFGSRELAARIKAVLRRTQETVVTASSERRPKRYHFDRWRLDTGARELVRDDGVTVPLSTGEYDLLLALVERPQRVLSRDQLLDLARGRAANTADREQAVRAVGGFAAAQRIANLTRLVQEAPREWRDRIVAVLSDQTLRVSLSTEPPAMTSAMAGDAGAQTIKDFLAEQASTDPGRQPRVAVSAPAGPWFGGWHPMMMGGRGPMMHGLGGFRDLQVA